jgi:2-polyprenyl-3-methyl-5-hydroxy-6-metoxy-1,4-benzoquinol methylase
MNAATEKEDRFAFGRNWLNFLATVDDASIRKAEQSLIELIGESDLTGKRFLDIGCGSGLFSLAARRLGAVVTGFDFDPDSVACARELRRRFARDDDTWRISQGSALDAEYLGALGTYDIVYSWGVLHHTGSLWQAVTNAAAAVAPGGKLAIAIYNDQGRWSGVWLRVKQLYQRVPRLLRPLYVALVMLPLELRSLAYSLLLLQPMRYVRGWTRYRSFRGMSRWHDHVDWVGGLPFEVAKPEQIVFFVKRLGFDLIGMTTNGGRTACNEYVFHRVAGS